MSTNSKIHTTLYTSKTLIIANIRYFYTEQKAKKGPVGQILVGSQNIVQEKKNIQKQISYSYLSREMYIRSIYSVR